MLYKDYFIWIFDMFSKDYLFEFFSMIFIITYKSIPLL